MPVEPEVLGPDVDLPDTTAVARLRHPAVPVTVNDLAALRGEAVEIIEARILVLETARMRAIRMTHPEDWVLFKAPDDRITGYLQDAGCDRVRDITGIEVFGISEPEKITSSDGKSFMYLIRGNGRSRLTMQVVEQMEGGRMSTDDFARDKTGAALELAVRKAARANLDGNITRELAGLKTVPLEELQKAWDGTGKKWEHCRFGRGFGTRDERLGGMKAGEPPVEPPTCTACPPDPKTGPVKLKYRQGKDGRKPFYGCPNYEKHPQQKVIVDAEKWVAEQTAKATAATATATREPGEEG
jgi:hypothetical protein